MFCMSIFLGLLLALLTICFVWEMRHSVRRSAESYRLIQAYRNDLYNKQLIQEIYGYCLKDWKLRRIIRQYDVTPDDMENLYQKLLLWGNFHKGHRFVPVTSFFYVSTFKYLVTHKNEDAKKLAMTCMNFLHI